MATRFTKDKARTETPRMKDVPHGETARDPSVGRDAAGRFAPGNPHALGQGWKATIRKSLGALAGDPAADDVVRQASKLYTATLRGLPSDGPAVRQLVAAQCRNTAIATFYSNEAARIGLATPDGLKLAEAARAHDKTAQGLSVAAFDRAVREAKSARDSRGPVDPLARYLTPRDDGGGKP